MYTRAGAIPDLPDPAGRAGMAAGTVTESDGTQSIIAAGGANFPQAAPGASTPEERGPKAYHQDIFKLRNGQWSKAGTLPAPLGYAAFASVGKGLAVAGGHNAEGILKDALLIKADGSVEKLPPLPVPVTEAAFAAHGNKLFVIGGRDSDQPEAALNTIYMLDTTPDTAKMKWASLPPFPGAAASSPPPPSVTAPCSSQGGLHPVQGCRRRNRQNVPFRHDRLRHDVQRSRRMGSRGQTAACRTGNARSRPPQAPPRYVKIPSSSSAGTSAATRRTRPSPWCSPATSWFMTSSETNGRTRGSGRRHRHRARRREGFRDHDHQRGNRPGRPDPVNASASAGTILK